MINARDGGVRWRETDVRRCETGYATDRGVDAVTPESRPQVTLLTRKPLALLFALS
jgi:hypothetical protein